MYPSRLGDTRLVSEHHRVHFAGFTATTPRLQQAGWELSAEQDMHRDSIRLALRHRDANLYAITNAIEFYRYAQSGQHGGLDFTVQRVTSQMMINLMENSFAFKPIDAFTQFTQVTRSIEDFNIFATPLVRTEELIVEPASVAQLLAQIREMQIPEQEAIRHRKHAARDRAGESSDAPQAQRKFHAQILSIAA